MIAKNTVIKLDKQHFDILGFTAALHSGFTVIAYRGAWGKASWEKVEQRETLLKIIGVPSAVKLNKLPTRGDSI